MFGGSIQQFKKKKLNNLEEKNLYICIKTAKEKKCAESVLWKSKKRQRERQPKNGKVLTKKASLHIRNEK